MSLPFFSEVALAFELHVLLPAQVRNPQIHPLFDRPQHRAFDRPQQDYVLTVRHGAAVHPVVHQLVLLY